MTSASCLFRSQETILGSSLRESLYTHHIRINCTCRASSCNCPSMPWRFQQQGHQPKTKLAVWQGGRFNAEETHPYMSLKCCTYSSKSGNHLTWWDILSLSLSIKRWGCWVEPPEFEKHAGQIEAFPLHFQGETPMLFETTSIYIPFTSPNVDAQLLKSPYIWVKWRAQFFEHTFCISWMSCQYTVSTWRPLVLLL